MLLNLSIRDFVLVDRLELEFGPGFAVLTGETGAGKSILLDALQLALGERADPSVVRDGTERAEIAVTFATPPGLAAWLVSNGLDGEEGECLLRRVVEAGGRSRGFINGRPATLSQMKEAGEFLVDIHGQHAHYSLLRPGVQRQLLDQFSDATSMAGQVAQLFRALKQLEQACRDAEHHAADVADERARLQWQVDELAALDFKVQDWVDLLEHHRRLAHAAELIQGAQHVVDWLEGEQQGAMPLLQQAHSRLVELAVIDTKLNPPLEMLDSALVQLQESVRDLTHYADRIDLEPEALDQAEARIASVNDIARKFHLRPEELPALLDESRSRLGELEHKADLAKLKQEVDEAKTTYLKAGQKLSGLRKKGAISLAKAVSDAMQKLSMQGGALSVALDPCEPDSAGLENVEFLVSPHSGQGLKPLSKTASGGELSRIGLALQTILSQKTGAPTLIFDEVDAGIGGSVAEIVGRMLAELGQRHQVLCVTHLPQVASGACRHFKVSKEARDGSAISHVTLLDPAERVEEVARMLGGVKITETTRRHAEEMLLSVRPV